MAAERADGSGGVLVTGAAGFIGFHVARALLARGERVIGLDSLDPYYDVRLKQDRLAALEGAFTFVRCDLADDAALAAAVEGVHFDRIVHLAAQAGVRYSLEAPLAYGRANLIGHLNVLELARQRNAAHLLYASSSSVYGAGRDLPFRVGSDADHPLSLYAATKRADELMSESYAHLFRLPQTGVRFFTVYGPWGRPDMAVWRFTEAVLEGRPITLYNHGEMRRDFTYIDDVVAGVLSMLDHPPIDGGEASPHVVYNLGAERSEQLQDLVQAIEASCGRRADIRFAPLQPGDAVDTFADAGPLKAAFGFEATIPIAEGVPRFVDWYREYRSARAETNR